MDTSKQYDQVVSQCRALFINKMKDYGPSWRILRPTSLTDQILIKARRIRTLEINGVTQVGEDIWPEFMGIINYGVIGLIQLEKGFSDFIDMTSEQALALYDKWIGETKDLMMAKNTDYGEAWRDMRVSSYTDIIQIGRSTRLNSSHIATSPSWPASRRLSVTTAARWCRKASTPTCRT